MIDQLKQVGILYGEGKNCQITGENIKSADYSKMSKGSRGVLPVSGNFAGSWN